MVKTGQTIIIWKGKSSVIFIHAFDEEADDAKCSLDMQVGDE